MRRLIQSWRAQYLIVALLGGAAVYLNLFISLPREIAGLIGRQETRRLETMAGLLTVYLETRAALGEPPDRALERVSPWLQDYTLYAIPPEALKEAADVQMLPVSLSDGRRLALGLRPVDCLACGDPSFWLRLLWLSLSIWVVLVMLHVFLWARFSRWFQGIRAAAEAIAAGVDRPPLPPPSPDELGQIAAALGQIAAAMGRFREAYRRFMMTAAHELLTPLSLLIDILQDLKAGSPSAIQERIDRALDQGKYLLQLVEDLLWVAREDRLAFPLHFQAIDLADVLIEMIEAYRSRFEASGRLLALHLTEVPLPIHGDPIRLRQILGNLLENALRYSRPGEIVQAIAGKGEQIVVEICGGTFGEGRPGLGLGMQIVDELTRAHGGRVEFLEGPEGALHARLIFPVAPPSILEAAHP
ncbi:MAG: sensor histidine kinase [Thermoflexus sp.]